MFFLINANITNCDIQNDILIVKSHNFEIQFCNIKIQSRYHINDIWARYQFLTQIQISNQRVNFFK